MTSPDEAPVNSTPPPPSGHRMTTPLLAAGLVLATAAVWWWRAAPGASPDDAQAAGTASPAVVVETAAQRAARLRQVDDDAGALERQVFGSDLPPATLTELPAWVRGVHIDAESGRAVIEASASLSGNEEMQVDEQRDQLAGSLWRVVHGESRVLRGDLLLVDRQGRAWATSGPWLLGYDGQTWEEQHADDRGTPRGAMMNFFTRAWEGARGERVFTTAGRLRTLSFHILLPNGLWHVRSDDHTRWVFFSSDATGVAQPDGTMHMARPFERSDERRLGDEDRATVLRFSPGQTVALDPRVCPEHDVLSVLPLGDGSMATICAGPRLWIKRDPTPAALDEMMVAMERATDVQQRGRIVEEVWHQGDDWRDVLRTAALEGRDQDRERRAWALLEALNERDAQATTAGVDPQVLSYFGRYEMGECHLLARTTAGAFAVAARDFADADRNVRYPQAIVRIAPDGQWTATPISGISFEDLVASGGNGTIDAKQRIWLPSGLLIDPTGAVTRVLPEGRPITQIIGRDIDGRLFVRSGNRTSVIRLTP